MQQQSRLSLTSLLVLGVFAEVLLHRIVSRLLDQHLVGFTGQSTLLHTVAGLLGQFAFHFTGVLALAISTWAIYALARDRQLLALPWRMAVGLCGAVLLSLATLALFVSIRARGELALELAFVAFIATLVLTVMVNRGPIRYELGLLFLSAIVVLRCSWIAEQQVAVLMQWPASHASWTLRLYSISDHLIAASGVVVISCFAPLARWRTLLRPLPLILSCVVTGLALVVVVSDYPFAELLAQRGFNLQLPSPSSLALGLHIAALFPFMLTVGALIFSDRVGTGISFGLLLIALSGYFLATPPAAARYPGRFAVARTKHPRATRQRSSSDDGRDAVRRSFCGAVESVSPTASRGMQRPTSDERSSRLVRPW
jgi:hypothetical protein